VPPRQGASFRLRIDADGGVHLLAGGAELAALCEDDVTRAQLLAAVREAVQRRDLPARLNLQFPTGGSRPISLSLAISADEHGSVLAEGRALRPQQLPGPKARPLRDIEAVLALWAHLETTARASERELAVLGQLTTLPEVAAARLHRQPGQGPVAQSALSQQQPVLEPVLRDPARATDPLLLRLWLPLAGYGTAGGLLELVLEPGVVPDSWQMELFEAYADLLALSAAPGDSPNHSPPLPTPPMPVRSQALPKPDALTPRLRELVYLRATGVDGTGELASRLGAAAPTVKAHLHSLMRRLGVGSRLELVRIALDDWADWLADERRRGGVA
jgi:DNA-binding CsgD family transcriptional regulator